MEGTTKSFAHFISSLRVEAVPRKVLETLKIHLVDTLGTILGGSASPESQAILRIFGPLRWEGEVSASL